MDVCKTYLNPPRLACETAIPGLAMRPPCSRHSGTLSAIFIGRGPLHERAGRTVSIPNTNGRPACRYSALRFFCFRVRCRRQYEVRADSYEIRRSIRMWRTRSELSGSMIAGRTGVRKLSGPAAASGRSNIQAISIIIINQVMSSHRSDYESPAQRMPCYCP
jgi:hypothetical protein